LNPKNRGFGLLIAVVLVALVSAAAGVALWKYLQTRQSPPMQALMVLPEPRVIADFSLRDHDGKPFNLENLRGRWSLIFFGFTHCPDVCPSTLYDLKQVHEQLSRAPGPADHQVLFVSVDPERDTPEQLKQYVAYFHPDFIGVTGGDEQLAPLTLQLGIAYRIEEHEPGAAQYGVDHSASVLLMDPRGRLHGVFPAPHDAAAMGADLAALLHQQGF
jgi:protein SCO1/2